MDKQIRQNMVRRRLISAVFVLSLFAVPAIVFAVTLTYTATPNAVISSAGINKNFTDLNTAKLEVGNIVRVVKEFPATNRPVTEAFDSASCPTGKVLIGGGCFTTAFFLTVLASGPSAFEANGYYCGFSNPGGFSNVQITDINVQAIAICAGP